MRMRRVQASLDTQTKELPALQAAVIVPGFLYGARDFQPLAEALTARGIPSVVVPMPFWHWIPCMGGRSMRPILERIDHTVRHLAALGPDSASDPQQPSTVPPFKYSLLDLVADFRNNPGGVLEVGGSAEPDEFTLWEPRGDFPALEEPAKGRVTLIGHSAGGWISRLYLSERAYGGKAYRGSELVHSLVTLGSPHGEAEGVAFANVAWAARDPLPPSTRCLAVAASGNKGDSSGDFTARAYEFCVPPGCAVEELDGDGVTPVESALAVPGAEQLVLEEVTHAPGYPSFVAPELAREYNAGKDWYGSERQLAKWVPWLMQQTP